MENEKVLELSAAAEPRTDTGRLLTILSTKKKYEIF